MRLASRVSNQRSLEDRQDMIRDLGDLSDLASPSIAATWEIASRKFEDVANSNEEMRTVEDIFSDSELDCSTYQPALDRWQP